MRLLAATATATATTATADLDDAATGVPREHLDDDGAEELRRDAGEWRQRLLRFVLRSRMSVLPTHRDVWRLRMPHDEGQVSRDAVR
jgi:hypothetical protein